MGNIIEMLKRIDKEMEDKNSFICRCSEKGKGLYCYRHSKEVI